MTYIDQLKSAVAQGGNCVNLGRSLEARHPELYRYCIEQTNFLNDRPNLKFNERVYCLIHGLTSRPLNARGEPANFENIHEGYILLNSIAKTRMAKQQRQQAAQRAADALNAQQEEAAERARLGVPPIPTRQELEAKLCTDDEDLLAKAAEHIRTWHKAAGKPLYVPGLTEGVDYIICPITGLRKSQIRRNYTENILGLTMAEYIECVGEDTPLICSGHGGKIAHGLHVVDEATGLTKSKISCMKTKERLSEVDLETGLTGYQKIGARTRATHMSKVDELGRNGYKRLADYRKNTVADNGKTIEQNALVKHSATLRKRGKYRLFGASAISKKKLRPILDYLNEAGISYYFDKNEYCLESPGFNKYYCDLAIPSVGVIIEYQSNAWHPDPRVDDESWRNWTPPRGKKLTADEKIRYDYNKAKFAFELTGWRTFFVWENTSAEDTEVILCMLKTQGTTS